MRRALGILLLLVALLCSVGYLAAGEPGTHWMWRIAYAIGGIAALGVGGRMLAQPPE